MSPTSRFSNTHERFRRGDHVKVEFKDTKSGEAEWMWVLVDFDDDKSGIVFGRLANAPVVYHGPNLRLGSRVAVEHRHIRGFKNSVIDPTTEYPAAYKIPRPYAEPEKE